MTAFRDYSAMKRDGHCIVCGLEFCPENSDPSLDEIFINLHIVEHLADGTAVIIVEDGLERVVPA